MLSIVIPTKNEEKYIKVLLNSICRQKGFNIRNIPIYIADAESIDKTVDTAMSFKDCLDIHVVKGGPVSVARNSGAKYVNTKYVVFIDADMELSDNNLLLKSLQIAEKKNLDLVTSNINCRENNILYRFIYCLNNLAQRISKYIGKPYATGMYMFFNLNKFKKLGGFNEKVTYAEDFYLSRNIERNKFDVVGKILTSDRRFRKMGIVKIVKMFLRIMIMSIIYKKDEVFFIDNKYFDN